MIDPFKHTPLRKRLLMAIWSVNIALCAALLIFALR